MSSSVVPPSFDPFATHFFTNIDNNALHPPPPPAPRAFPLSVPAPSQFYAHGHGHGHGHGYGHGGHDNGQVQHGQVSSLPTAQTPMPTNTTNTMHAPQPTRGGPAPNQQQPKPIFEPFRLDRASPDLQDVLAKKGPHAQAKPKARK